MPPEVSEIFHRKESFLVSPFASEGKTDEGKEFDPVSLDKVVAKRTQLSRAAFLCLGKGTAHGNYVVLPPEKRVI